MSEFISPSQPQRGFSSHISPIEIKIPENVKADLQGIIGVLQHLKTELQNEKPHLEKLVDGFDQLDKNIMNFHIDMHHEAKHGTDARHTLDVCLQAFLEELDGIKNSHETSMRDVKDNPVKFKDFLKHLIHSPHGRADLHHVGELCQTFSNELSKSFLKH